MNSINTTAPANTELSEALALLLTEYTELLSSGQGDVWSAREEKTVRNVRDVLTRAGRMPKLRYEVQRHIDYPYFGMR